MLVGILGVASAGAGTAATTTSPPGTTAPPPTLVSPPTTAPLPVVSIVGMTDGWWTWGSAGVCSDTVSPRTSAASITLGTSSPGPQILVAIDIDPAGLVATPLEYPPGQPVLHLADGALQQTSDLEPELFRTGTVTIELLPGDGYVVGSPSVATLEIVERDDDPGCGPPTFTAAPSNTIQHVPVGGTLLPLDFVPYPGGTAYAAFDSGELPPGVELQPDGGFSGAADRPGTYTAVIGACTPAFVGSDVPSELPGTCALTTLTVVVGDGSPPIPVTG